MGVAWWRSLYWRIGVSFVVLVLAVVLAQGLIVSRALERSSQGLRTPPNVIATDVAFGVSAALSRDDDARLETVVRDRASGWTDVHVVLHDGRVVSASSTPLSPGLLAAMREAIADTPVDRRSPPHVEGPVVTAPVQVDGQLRGLVVMPPPPRGMFSEAGRLLSLPGTLVLLAAAAFAAFVIFAPARRRLGDLERAANRIWRGDLQARASATGGDEIARVAQAFNRMGDEIAARDEALRRSDELRRQMLADVSHELKTPLTAMRGFIDTLQMPEVATDDARRTRYFETLSRETRRLERLVADLLDVARFESGAIELDVQVFDTARLFEHVARRHEQASRELGVALVVEVEPDADQVTGDPHRLEQALENFVANALRHTPSGGTVMLSARVEGSELRLAVADTGRGIPADHLAHVFERFYKADPSRAGAETGSGLGLSIVKAIARRHGGRVGVESRPGHTVFSLWLPAAPTS